MPSWLAVLRSYLGASAIGHLVWEVAQLPLYTIWSTGTLRENAIAIAHCTAGDMMIATLSIVTALVLAANLNWPDDRFRPVAALTIIIGVAYTVFSEWLNTVVRASWSYSDWMPVLDIFGFRLGLTPMLQWVVVPVWAIWLASRAHRLRPRSALGSHNVLPAAPKAS